MNNIIKKFFNSFVLFFSIVCANQSLALVYGAETLFDPVAGGYVTLLHEAHIDLPDLKRTEQQRYAIENILHHYCNGLVVEDMRSVGCAQKMPDVRQILEAQLPKFQQIKHLRKTCYIQLDESAFQETIRIAVMRRLADYCDSIKYPCINAECRHVLRNAFVEQIPVPGHKILKNLQEHMGKIVDFSRDEFEDNPVIKSFYAQSMLECYEWLKQCAENLPKLQTPVDVLIQNEDLVSAGGLVDGYSLHGIRALRYNNHILVCQGGAHCERQTDVLLKSGYKKVFSCVYPYTKKESHDGILIEKFMPLDIEDYFERLYKECKIPLKKESDTAVLTASHMPEKEWMV